MVEEVGGIALWRSDGTWAALMEWWGRCPVRLREGGGECACFRKLIRTSKRSETVFSVVSEEEGKGGFLSREGKVVSEGRSIVVLERD